MQEAQTKSFPFKIISEKDVALQNSILGQVRPIAFNFREQDYVLRFTKLTGKARASIHFKLKMDQKVLWLGLEPSPDVEFFDPSMSGLSMEELPPDVSSLLMESFCEELLDTVEEALDSRFTLEAVTFKEPHEPFDYCLRFAIDTDEQDAAYSGYLAMSEYTLDFFASHIAKVPAMALGAWDSVPCFARVLAGQTLLTGADYKNLSTNDIVLMDEPARFNQGIYFLQFTQTLSYDIQLDNETATILKMTDLPSDLNKEQPDESFQDLDDDVSLETFDEDSEEQEETSEAVSFEDTEELEDGVSAEDTSAEELHLEPEVEMPVSAPEAAVSAPEAVAATIDELKVRLSFEVGQKQISLNELKTLSNGYTFELDSPLSKPITIRANGSSVGQGELLQIGDKVGVRITDIK